MIEPALFTATPAPEEDVTTTLYRAAIGPVSNSYYLPIFTRFEAADHAGISWNTAASLMTLNWLVFRKLWVAALAYVGIVVAVALLVFGVGYLVFQFSDTLMMALGLGLGLAAFVLPGLFGNALLHTECRKAMSQALVGNANVADARDQLLRQASSPKRLIVLAVVNAALLVLLFIAYQQFSGMGHVAVMPHGALDAGNVAVGRADAVEPARPPASSASSASSPMPSASAAQAAASAAASASSAPASQPAAVAAASSASAASAAASDAAATPPVVRTAAASEPLVAASASPSKMAAMPVAQASAAPAKAQAKPPAKAAAKVPEAAGAEQKVEPRAASAPAVQVQARKDAAKAPKASKKEPAPPVATNETAAKSFFINVGLFAVPENAAKAHAKLLEAGLPSVMKELKAKTRQIRVRVGPFSTQAQAESAAEKIKALELEAAIIEL